MLSGGKHGRLALKTGDDAGNGGSAYTIPLRTRSFFYYVNMLDWAWPINAPKILGLINPDKRGWQMKSSSWDNNDFHR